MKTKFLIIIGFILLAVSCDRNKKKDITPVDSIPKSKVQIFGAYPYWQKNLKENNRFNLLTSLSYYSYDLEPKTGNFKTIRDWETSSVIDSAKNYGAKTYLTVTNFGEKNNTLFLLNNEAQHTSIVTIERLLQQRDANGVIINFEHIPLKCVDAFALYIKKLNKRLKKSNKDIIITIPGNNQLVNSRAYDFARLTLDVSYFIITYSDLSNDSITYAGPVAPMYSNNIWNHISVENTVNFYTNGKIPSGKLLLSIPYFGSKWEVIDDNFPSKKVKFIGHLSYAEIMSKMNPEPIYENQSQSVFFNFNETGKKIQIWYDDQKTLKAKYDFVLQQKLGGVYLWALGYDNGYYELWDAIDEKLWTK